MVTTNMPLQNSEVWFESRLPSLEASSLRGSFSLISDYFSEAQFRRNPLKYL